MQIAEMIAEQVILVDAQDNEIGLMEKQEAHEKGALHRAFSVFVFNAAGEMLLQRRALHKYHSGGLWTNTCCSHPRPGEGNLAAAQRRLQEEMGFACPLEHMFSFLYEQAVGDLIEHELDHVFVGTFEGMPTINPDEVAEWRYCAMAELRADMALHPAHYTIWFRLCLDRVEEHLQGEPMGQDGKISYFH
jgi:isopentenyl-diphosphate Delta-isomerase